MTARGMFAAPLFLLLATTPLLAQHEGHQMPARPDEPSTSPAIPASCAEALRQAMWLVERADRRLETARQSNRPAEMRAAMDDLQTVLGAIRTQVSTCVPPESPHPAPGMVDTPPAGSPPSSTHTMPGMPGMSHDAGQKPAPDRATDPVCGRKVDPSTAPSASYEGTTYYFCSESDRQTFLSDPSKCVSRHEH